jgi:hypothetical protein
MSHAIPTSQCRLFIKLLANGVEIITKYVYAVCITLQLVGMQAWLVYTII